MIQVGLLTLEEKKQIEGQLFNGLSRFNPVQDANENWVISIEEIEQCNVDAFSFVKELPLIEFEPVLSDEFV